MANEASARESTEEKRPFSLADVATSPWAWLVVVSTGLLLAYVVLSRKRTPPLPILGEIPAFHLTDQNAQTATADSLAGKPFIADFIFLGCQQSCPKLTARMATLQQTLETRGDAIHLVSFSVDPDNDTPERLKAYGARFSAHDATWTFLTGAHEDVNAIVVQGFKMQYAAKASPGAGVFEIMHGDWFVLVDGKGRIRGYYDTNEDGKMDALLADAERLAKDSGS